MDKPLKIDRSKWNKPSYLGHYDEKAEFYEGIRTTCTKCGLSFVFSAQLQKNAFENLKKYPGWIPSLCTSCSEEWEVTKNKLLSFQENWDNNIDNCQRNITYMENWLSLLKSAREFGKRDLESQIRMINKKISELE